MKTKTAKIQWNKVPKTDKDIVSRCLIQWITEFYSDPINMAAFEEWKASRDKAEAAVIGG